MNSAAMFGAMPTLETSLEDYLKLAAANGVQITPAVRAVFFAGAMASLSGLARRAGAEGFTDAGRRALVEQITEIQAVSEEHATMNDEQVKTQLRVMTDTVTKMMPGRSVVVVSFPDNDPDPSRIHYASNVSGAEVERALGVVLGGFGKPASLPAA